MYSTKICPTDVSANKALDDPHQMQLSCFCSTAGQESERSMSNRERVEARASYCSLVDGVLIVM